LQIADFSLEMKRKLHIILSLVICVILIASCQPNRKNNAETASAEQIATAENIVVYNIDNEIDELAWWKFAVKILDDVYSLPDSIGYRLPASARDYFLNVDFPYSFPDFLHIDYFNKRKQFQIEDFFIFKAKNGFQTCEYIALISTQPFIEIVARQCVDMENWIKLYVLNENYEVVDFALLLIDFLGAIDYVSLKFDNQNIRFFDRIDSLIYSNREYKIFSDELFDITDKFGNIKRDIGIRRLNIFTVNDEGKIVALRDSIIHKREYYDIYWEKQREFADW